MIPEFKLAWSGVALGSVPCLAPSESRPGAFSPTRAVGTAGSVPNVMVWGCPGRYSSTPRFLDAHPNGLWPGTA